MKYYFSFDVESRGILGTPFAVGWVIVDETGKEWGDGYLAVPATFYHSDPTDQWLIENVAPALPVLPVKQFLSQNDEVFIGTTGNCERSYHLYERFWSAWEQAKKLYPGILMVTDCQFPVEAEFLLRVHRDSEVNLTIENSPYPLIDVASVLFAHGHGPIANYDRKENELPVHHPTNDARQSVRIMLAALKGDL